MAQSESLYRRIHSTFNASISELHDCGRICAPLNGGQPVCCTTDHAIPVVDQAEWQVLRKKTDLWKRYTADDPESKAVLAEFPSSCCAVECKGAQFCERDNRTLACRSFPFFPYFNREKENVGITYYWTFEDRCWVTSNLQIVEPKFVKEFLATYDLVFREDETERQTFVEYSASMRRVFSRWKRPLPVLGADGQLYKVLPSDGTLYPAEKKDFPPNRVFASDKNYRKEIRAYGYDPKGATLYPDWAKGRQM